MSESPAFADIPEEHRAATLVALNWLDEPRIYRSPLGSHLPDGLRMPTVFGIDESTERITIWMEDTPDVTPWDLDRYHRTARALGRMGGRCAALGRPGELGLSTRDIGGLFFGKVVHFDLMTQADDRFWLDPAVAETVDAAHRDDLARAAELMPARIAELEHLPFGVCHGDAAPDNFREPGDGTIVAIDWSYGHVGPLGGDLGQLLAGRIESGCASAAQVTDMATIAATIVDGYLEGLGDEGLAVEPADVERAWVTYFAIRSVFSALVVGERPDLDPDARRELIGRRAALGRFGLDLLLGSTGHR